VTKGTQVHFVLKICMVRKDQQIAAIIKGVLKNLRSFELHFLTFYCNLLVFVLQPGHRGGNEEIEDYVIEAERLLSQTVVSACTADNPDIRRILQDNWSTDIPTPINLGLLHYTLYG